ncbi:MAG: 6-phosphofructokinase [Spirochaetes bacterium]|jgi:6-phosphofructokinase 1|nr:6-phosphofructokinase [Spirochaetota bacterium]
MIKPKHKNVGILFSGGPAPSANAVISSVALNLIDKNIPVIGIMRGYEFIQDFNKNYPKLRKDVHYGIITQEITKARNRSGVFLRTSRANPGKDIKTMEDLNDPIKNARLKNILDAFESLQIGALISVGGDDTLKTANFLWLMGFPVIHIPKTIDNDYYGIPWTFGYWTAVDVAQKILLNLKADAQATDSFFIVELMGRKAGWITYAAGIAGEVILMISNEDIRGDIIDLEGIVEKITEVIISRENDKKPYGVIAISEGLVDKLPQEMKPKITDRHGNIIYSEAKISTMIADLVKEKYKEKTGLGIKITPKQIGYEIRSAHPTAFDVVMGCMLGYGAAKFYEENNFGVMVSVTDNFDVKTVPFTDLIDKETMLTRLRDVPSGSDFFTLKDRMQYQHLFE